MKPNPGTASRIKRFATVAVCVTLAAVGMFYVEFFVFPDTIPSTPFEDCWFWVWTVISLLLSLVWMMSQKDPPVIVMILLTIASGLFWASIVELFITVRRRLRPGKSLQNQRDGI